MSFYRYWGKTAGEGFSHLLPYHCLDVAAVADRWWQSDKALRETFIRLSRTSEKHLHAWLLFFAALHDFGKFDVRFQLKEKDLALRLNSIFERADHAASRGFDHGVAGLYWFIKEAESFGFTGEAYYQAVDWARAVTGHHGVIKESAKINTPQADTDVIAYDRDARRSWVEHLKETFLERAGIKPDEPPPEINNNQRDFIAGFYSVCDWLGSNETYFPYETGNIDLGTYFNSRRDYAKKALHESGLVGKFCSKGGMANIYPKFSELIGAQTAADALPTLPGFTLIEAPTGSGKTEAALAHASRLIAAGCADGIIFALPTQATANAMLRRINEVANKLFTGGINVVLAHGKARFDGFFKSMKSVALHKPHGDGDARAQCAYWLAESRKRVFLGQIGVCTIDQVLLSVLPLRHKFVRGFGLGRNVLIVDEIHAYDSYMNGLIDEILKAQKAVGGSAILLSATLPAKRRAELIRSWGEECLEDGAAYPLVTCADENGIETYHVEPPPPVSVGLSLTRTPEALPDESLLYEICQAVKAGAKVALICNLVADAQRLARRMEISLCGDMDVFHSRYRFRDRQEIEERVIQEYGADTKRDGGRLIVATQVVEQSLDLDFDWMITQLCPVDPLFQRLGRLHRRTGNSRPPGFGSPRATVIAPEGDDFGLHGVLYNPASLWYTRELIEKNSVVEFPCAYREWIEAVYSDEPWPDEPEGVMKANERFIGEEMAKRSEAMRLTSPYITPFSDTDENATYLTRDGEMSLNVVPVFIGKKEFLNGTVISSLNEYEHAEAINMESIPVPHSWKRLLPEPKDNVYWFEMSQDGVGRWRAATDKAKFVYTKKFGLEIEKDDKP